MGEALGEKQEVRLPAAVVLPPPPPDALPLPLLLRLAGAGLALPELLGNCAVAETAGLGVAGAVSEPPMPGEALTLIVTAAVAQVEEVGALLAVARTVPVDAAEEEPLSVLNELPVEQGDEVSVAPRPGLAEALGEGVERKVAAAVPELGEVGVLVAVGPPPGDKEEDAEDSGAVIEGVWERVGGGEDVGDAETAPLCEKELLREDDSLEARLALAQAELLGVCD